MRVALVIETLRAGGAERVVSLVADELARRGHQVTVVTFAAPETDFFRVTPDVRRTHIDPSPSGLAWRTGISRNAVRVVRLRRALTRLDPDVVAAFIDTTNVVALVASAAAPWPVVVAERTDPRRWPLGRAWGSLRRIVYPRAAGVVAQTAGVAAWLSRFVDSRRVHVVPNPVRAVEAQRRAREPLVVGVGRLGREKGFDLLVAAFAEAGEAAAGWQLAIAGAGPELRALESQAVRLGVAARVDLVGELSEEDVQALYDRASIFVLPSRLEGFPNALLEAMAHGVAVVAADCDSGPRDIVTHGVDGLLVPPEDPRAIAAAVTTLAADPAARTALGDAARDVARRFSVAAIVDRWEHLLASAAAERRNNVGSLGARRGPRRVR